MQFRGDRWAGREREEKKKIKKNGTIQREFWTRGTLGSYSRRAPSCFSLGDISSASEIIAPPVASYKAVQALFENE